MPMPTPKDLRAVQDASISSIPLAFFETQNSAVGAFGVGQRMMDDAKLDVRATDINLNNSKDPNLGNSLNGEVSIV